MQTQALYSDFGTLAELRCSARQDADGTLEAVAAQFESLFVQLMLKSMRDATTRGGLFESHQLETYEQMHDQQLALDLSGRGGIGLARVLVEQLRSSGSDRGADAAEAAPGRDLQRYLAAPVPTRRAADAPAAVAAAAPPASPGEFLARLRPLAESAAQRLGVAPEALLAQAALETGWGRHVRGDRHGSSNNFFNIKAGSGWQGPTVSVQTVEYRDGIAVRERAELRAYPNAAASFADYVALIAGSPRYREALAAGTDSAAYLRALQRAGYATDPAYADKALAILDRDAVGEPTNGLKKIAQLPL